MNYFIAFIPIEESQSQKYNEIPILSTKYKRLLSPLPQTSYKWANSSNLALFSPGVKEIYFLAFNLGSKQDIVDILKLVSLSSPFNIKEIFPNVKHIADELNHCFLSQDTLVCLFVVINVFHTSPLAKLHKAPLLITIT